MVKRMTRLILIATVFMLVSGPVGAETIWTCAYPGYTPKKDTVIIKFVQNGKTIRGNYSKYDVLQDNDAGLVAVASFSDWVKGGNPPIERLELGAFVIMIDKKSMRFRRGNVLYGEDDGAVRYGKCTKD
jgi:hypothetical protein